MRRTRVTHDIMQELHEAESRAMRSKRVALVLAKLAGPAAAELPYPVEADSEDRFQPQTVEEAEDRLNLLGNVIDINIELLNGVRNVDVRNGLLQEITSTYRRQDKVAGGIIDVVIASNLLPDPTRIEHA